MFSSWTIAQIEAMRQGIAWNLAHPGVSIPSADQCCNFGAQECDGWAEPNGWCKGCWALIVPNEEAS